MQNYVFIYHNEVHMESSKEMMDAWMKWFEGLGDKLVDGGNPFNPAAQAQVKGSTVTMDADSVSGYTIIKAANLEEAVTIAKTCPMVGAEGASINVYETMAM